MEKIVIPKAGKSKAELLKILRDLKSEFSTKISENDAVIEETPDGYKVRAEKKILFLSFYVDANITAKEGEYEISWDSNAPKDKVEDALAKVKDVLSRS